MKLFCFFFLLIIYCFDRTLSQPAIMTLSADSVSATSAELTAFVYPYGTETEVEFLIRKTGITCELVDDIIQYPYPVNGSSASAEVSIIVYRLAPNAQYHYVARARHIGEHQYAYGGELTVTTLSDSGAKGFAVPVWFKDQSGIWLAPRKFGVHTRASSCIDVNLGECELPPFPPNSSEFRFVEPRQSPNSCFGLGTYQDLREFRNSSQADTFRIQFLSANNQYPVILSWPNLQNYFSGNVTMTDFFGGSIINVDMKKETSCTISVPLTDIMIITNGPVNLVASNFDYWKNDGVILKGTFKPQGLTTESWFEWGLTSEYGNNTKKKIVSIADTAVEFSDSISGLLPGQCYHYRSIIQNRYGTVYGIDHVFETPVTSTDLRTIQEQPKEFRLYQNYPNPFNPLTIMHYQLLINNYTTLKIYNVLGQEISTLVNEIKDAGTHEVNWDALNYPGGVYYYRLVSGRFSETKKMVLIK